MFSNIIINLIIVEWINSANFSKTDVCLILISGIMPTIGLQFVCLVTSLTMNEITLYILGTSHGINDINYSENKASSFLITLKKYVTCEMKKEYKYKRR